MPPPSFSPGDRVIVDLRGNDQAPAGARDHEEATVLDVDLGSGIVTVQLTGLPAGTPNIGGLPFDRVTLIP